MAIEIKKIEGKTSFPRQNPLDPLKLYLESKQLSAENILNVEFKSSDSDLRYNGAMMSIDGKICILPRAQVPPNGHTFSTSRIEFSNFNEKDGSFEIDERFCIPNAEDPTPFVFHSKEGETKVALGYVNVENAMLVDGMFSGFNTEYSLFDPTTLSMKDSKEPLFTWQKDQKDQRMVELPNGRILVLLRKRIEDRETREVDSQIYWEYLEHGQKLTSDWERKITDDPSHLLVNFAGNQWGGPNQLAVVDKKDGTRVLLMLMHFAYKTGKKIDGEEERVYFSGLAEIGFDGDTPRFSNNITLLPTQLDIEKKMGKMKSISPALSNVTFGTGMIFVRPKDKSKKYGLAVLMGVGDAQMCIKRIGEIDYIPANMDTNAYIIVDEDYYNSFEAALRRNALNMH